MAMMGEPLQTMLPLALPHGETEQRLLFAIRRIAAHGLNDAQASYGMLLWLGMSFRRPLILIRSLMAELSRVSARRITVAPCCCSRMTGDEAVLMRALDEALLRPADAHRRVAALMGVKQCLGVVVSLQAVAQACSDVGLPLGTGIAVDCV